MSWKYLAAGLLAFVPLSVEAGDSHVLLGGPGPYEVHHYLHRPNSFDRPPYFATNPPVYYGPDRYVRSYGWTPYPYQGIQYRLPLTQPIEDDVELVPAPAKPTKQKSSPKKSRSLNETRVSRR